jgi:hypothetical protein
MNYEKGNIGPFIGMSKPDRKPHDPAQMVQGRGLRYNYKSWSAGFRCPTCNRVRQANLNYLGSGGRIYCNGVKTAIQYSGYNYRLLADLFKAKQ